jgi:hypothetical protein
MNKDLLKIMAAEAKLQERPSNDNEDSDGSSDDEPDPHPAIASKIEQQSHNDRGSESVASRQSELSNKLPTQI